MSDPASFDTRTLILAPTGRDAALAHAALEKAGITAVICRDMETLCREFQAGLGAALIAKEALDAPALERLLGALTAQPAWSDPPLIILTSSGPSTAERRRRREALSSLGNATLLERPLRIATLVSTVRVALQTRQRQYELRDHLIERERLETALQVEYEKQHRIAEMFQSSLLTPPAPDAFPHLEVQTLYQAAREEAEIGGDFFDAFRLNDDRVALLVGDVSGKGLDAASHTAELKSILRAFLREDPSPAQALDRLNDFLLDAQTLDQQPLDNFVCLAIAVLDTTSGTLSVANAGEEPPLAMLGHELYPVSEHSTPLGVTATAEYTNETLTLAAGDTLLLLTDGITEARCGRAFFGYDGFVETLEQVRERVTLRELNQAVMDAATSFAGGQLSDDICLLAARFSGPSSSDPG